MRHGRVSFSPSRCLLFSLFVFSSTHSHRCSDWCECTTTWILSAHFTIRFCCHSTINGMSLKDADWDDSIYYCYRRNQCFTYISHTTAIVFSFHLNRNHWRILIYAAIGMNTIEWNVCCIVCFVLGFGKWLGWGSLICQERTKEKKCFLWEIGRRQPRHLIWNTLNPREGHVYFMWIVVTETLSMAPMEIIFFWGWEISWCDFRVRPHFMQRTWCLLMISVHDCREETQY